MIIDVLQLYSEGKTDEIAIYLKNQTRILLRLSESSRTSAERLIFAVKGLPADCKASYIQSKIDYYTTLVEQLKKSTAREQK